MLLQGSAAICCDLQRTFAAGLVLAIVWVSFPCKPCAVCSILCCLFEQAGFSGLLLQEDSARRVQPKSVALLSWMRTRASLTLLRTRRKDHYRAPRVLTLSSCWSSSSTLRGTRWQFQVVSPAFCCCLPPHLTGMVHQISSQSGSAGSWSRCCI
jgi:hypothetical protein